MSYFNSSDSLISMTPVECVTRLTLLPEDESPHKRKWYKYDAKVGTTCGTIIWVVDKPVINLNDHIIFIDMIKSLNYDPNNKKVQFYFYDYESTLNRGVVDFINRERIFVTY